MTEQMTVSYKKLWELLIDLHRNKEDLQAATFTSPSSTPKLFKNEKSVWTVLQGLLSARYQFRRYYLISARYS